MEQWILAIDQSTQNTKAMVFDRRLALLGQAAYEHTQIYPREGWVEHDLSEITANVARSAKDALKRADFDPSIHEICAVALSNQRETLALWNKATGEPVSNALVWQDARAQGILETLVKANPDASRMVQERSGMPLSPLFSAAKLAWAVNHDEAVKSLAASGQLCAGTMDAFLCQTLGGETACDLTNASRTQLMNLKELAWDHDLIAFFGVKNVHLPAIKRSDEIFGHTDLFGALPKKAPIIGVTGDSQGAFYALGCHRPGMAKASYGTGSSVMANVGADPVLSNRLAATVGYAVRGDLAYALEGNISHSADVVSWLTRDMGLCPTPAQTEQMALSVPSSGGVYLVPAFTGLGAPWFEPNARAMLCGMSRSVTPAHVVRASLEAIAHQIDDVLDAMAQDADVRIAQLLCDGGASANGFLMRYQSDILGYPVVVARHDNLSALGAARLAACGLGWSDILQSPLFDTTLYTPEMQPGERETRRQGWKTAVDTALFFASKQNIQPGGT